MNDYINEGRDLINGHLPAFTFNPAVACLYALTYLLVHTSPFWLVQSCSIGRFILFSLLWGGGFLVACELSELASPFVMIAMLASSPVLPGLLNNGANALFAAMSGFALWQFLSFYRTRILKHLWLCSLFLGIAALSRNEGAVLFLTFLGLALALCIPAGLVRKGLTASIVPFAVLVGGYLLLYGLCTGDFDPGIAKRSYVTFEQGHGMAFAEKYGSGQFYVEGQLDARRLFGTGEENHFSVFNAIRRNPKAYLQRILPLTKHAVTDAVGGYGWYFGLFCFAFAVRGIIALIEKRSFMLLATLLLWQAYSVLYVLLCYQPAHLLMPFLSVFSLASTGIFAFSGNLSSKTERYAWSAVLVALFLAAAARDVLPNGPLTAVLVMFLGLSLIWILTDRWSPLPRINALACLVLLTIALLMRFGLPQAKARILGKSADERATIYLSTHFKPDSRIGAWGPGDIDDAKMKQVPMALDLRNLKSTQDVLNWMSREKVDAIYVDDYLRTFEPEVSHTLQNQIGHGLSVAYDSGAGAVQILVRTPSH